MTTPSPDIEFQYAGEFIDLPQESLFYAWVNAALHAAHINPASALTVRMVDAAEGAELNHAWRHKSAPTNILSFPFEAPEGLPAGVLPPYLGDLVLCVPVIRREAVEQGKTEPAHWAHLIVHGILHLAGYDHLTDSDAAEMEVLETQILRGLGYPDPYSEEAL